MQVLDLCWMGKEVILEKNEGENNLHSGPDGFEKKIWEVKHIDQDDNSVTLGRISPDGENGFPGEFNITVTYEFTEENSIRIVYSGVSDKTTIANMTNHSYFNLSGEGSGRYAGSSILQSMHRNILLWEKARFPLEKMFPWKELLWISAEKNKIGHFLDTCRVDTSVLYQLVQARRAISRRTGSKPDNTIASGVSSTTISIPVAASNARMLRPSRPMIRPLISSDSTWKTAIEFSIAVSVATRWMDWITIFFASLLAVIFASSIDFIDVGSSF